jgi:hypothetical protein
VERAGTETHCAAKYSTNDKSLVFFRDLRPPCDNTVLRFRAGFLASRPRSGCGSQSVLTIWITGYLLTHVETDAVFVALFKVLTIYCTPFTVLLAFIRYLIFARLACNTQGLLHDSNGTTCAHPT